jgi:cytochrome c6
MKRITVGFLAVAVSTLIAATAFAGGKDNFMASCVMCHPFGGNLKFWKKGKSLHKKDLEANHLSTADDLVKYMRSPGPGMTVFYQQDLPDKDAKDVADYILKTYK